MSGAEPSPRKRRHSSGAGSSSQKKNLPLMRESFDVQNASERLKAIEEQAMKLHEELQEFLKYIKPYTERIEEAKEVSTLPPEMEEDEDDDASPEMRVALEEASTYFNAAIIRRRKNRQESYGIYLTRVLKASCPDAAITGVALQILDNMTAELFEKIGRQASELARRVHRKTLLDEDVEAAAKLTLKGALRNSALRRSQNAIRKYQQYK